MLTWIYRRLFLAFGKQKWWPAESPFEVIVGAILTQGTAWSNVEKSILLLRKSPLTPHHLYSMRRKDLSKRIRSSGFFNVKSKRLQNFLSYLFKQWNGNLDRMFQTPLSILRRGLLSVSGLGRETVDSILLYAGGKPIFVVDAYTRRIFSQHGFFQEDEPYDVIQDYFMKSLPHDSPLFNEYHALLVKVGKEHCRATPFCRGCPLDPLPRRIKSHLEKNR